MSASLRILIADDHEMIRRGLRSLLQAREEWVICGEAINGREAVAEAQRLKPDVVIMDISMPELNGLEATRMIRKRVPECEVLVLTMHHSEHLAQEVLAAGARSYMLKSDPSELIIEAVQSLSRGRPFFTSKVSEMLLNAYLDGEDEASRTSGVAALTAREREIIQMIAEGKSSKQIASLIGVSDKTVETHRTNLMRKLNIHSVSEIVRYAIRNKMIEP